MKSAGWIFTGKTEKKTALPESAGGGGKGAAQWAPDPLFKGSGKGAPRNGGGSPPKSSTSNNRALMRTAPTGWNTNAPEFIPSEAPTTVAYPAPYPAEWGGSGRWQSQGWRKWTDGVPSEHEQFDMWEKEWNTAKMKDGKILVVLVDGKPSEDAATLAAANGTNGAKPKQTSSPYDTNGASRKAKGKASKATKATWKPKGEKAAPTEDGGAATEAEAPVKSAEAESS
jgi:hypothetical protein